MVDLGRSELTLAAVAGELGTSAALLLRALVAQGTTLHRLMGQLRIDRLSALLRDPADDRSLTELSADAGFAGTAQAARAFRQFFGTTMSRYRTMMRPQ
ncbi:helix-turn-helix domain-containing protein [Microbacteriaceae bacterium VKM Ac-2854]|nr:helix-turn-helix domain-containing protein [Microbacteriaceae bacterium VKM Ac-2854]